MTSVSVHSTDNLSEMSILLRDDKTYGFSPKRKKTIIVIKVPWSFKSHKLILAATIESIYIWLRYSNKVKKCSKHNTT